MSRKPRVRIHLQFTIGLAALLLTASCTPDSQKQKPDDPLQESRQKLELRDYDGALSALERARAEHASVNQVRVLTATAYLGRAGITVQRYFPLAERLTERNSPNENPLKELASVYTLNDDTSNDPFARFIIDLARANGELSWYLDIFERIPDFAPSVRPDIENAVAALESLDSSTASLSSGLFLFRALTRAIYLKHHLLYVLKPIIQPTAICASRVRDLILDLSILRNQGAALMLDLSSAIPANAEGLMKSRASFLQNMMFLDTFQNIFQTFIDGNTTVLSLFEQLSANAPENIKGVLKCRP